MTRIIKYYQEKNQCQVTNSLWPKAILDKTCLSLAETNNS